MKRGLCYIAVDLGASSGRCLVGSLDNGVLSIQEVHRFPNNMVRVAEHLYWDIPYLYEQVIKSFEACSASDKKHIASIGIDTWGVDFGVLDVGGNLLGMPHTYRDARTKGMMQDFFQYMNKQEIYARTGVQFLSINTLYQLFAMRQKNDPFLDVMRDILFIPDIFMYFLTGNKVTEFTCATTSQLYNPINATWDAEVFKALSISVDVMQEIVQPGTVVGTVREPRVADSGVWQIPVIAVATHDTGSAIAAIPCTSEPCVYISCGTWSLMGFEADYPMISDQTRECNFTNEGGVEGTFRVLKNITGLWLLQECQKVWARDQIRAYDDLLIQAAKAEAFRTLIDPEDSSFTAPENMLVAIASFARGTEQPEPETIGQFTRCIAESLALRYRQTFDEIQELLPRPIFAIHMVGGGSQNPLLCQMTANALGMPVYAGPAEATAIGNILVQALSAKQVASLPDLRAVVRNSFEIKEYEPHDTGVWNEQYNRFKAMKKTNRSEQER